MTDKTADDAPLEWWEEIQINLLESLELVEDAARFRKNPAEWRRVRRQMQAMKTEQEG